MNDIRALKEYVVAFRKRVETSWSDETASPKVKPLNGKPASAGQCAPTSILLFSGLKKEFGNELPLKIALGKVFHAGNENAAIEFHVWLQLHKHTYRETFVVDATADQGTGIEDAVIFEQNTELVTSSNLIYLPYNLFSNPSELSIGAQKRAKLLSQRITNANG